MNIESITASLEAGGHDSFIGPLKRRGFHFITEERDENVLAHLAERFGAHVRDGIVIFPMGFGGYYDSRTRPWKTVLAAAEQYAATLEAAGFKTEILLREHSWNFYAYVLVLSGPDEFIQPAEESAAAPKDGATSSPDEHRKARRGSSFSCN